MFQLNHRQPPVGWAVGWLTLQQTVSRGAVAQIPTAEGRLFILAIQLVSTNRHTQYHDKWDAPLRAQTTEYTAAGRAIAVSPLLHFLLWIHAARIVD